MISRKIRVKTKEELRNNGKITLEDSTLIKPYDYTTVQRVIGENLKALTLVYDSNMDGQTFQDLTRKLDEFKTLTKTNVETWVYIVRTRSATFGFKTIVQGDKLIECYMFSFELQRRFYSYLDKTTVHSYYPNGIDLFDDIGYGRLYKPMFYSNKCSYWSIIGPILNRGQFFVNSIELYRMTNKVDVSTDDSEIDITNLAYQLPNETKSKLISLNSDILQWDNLNVFERLITRLDNIMLYAQLKPNSPTDLRKIDFKRLTDRDNILILYKLNNGHIFALYIPRIDYNCIEDYNKYCQLTLYSITFNAVIPLSNWTIRIDKSNHNETITIETYDLKFKPIKIRDNYTKPMTINYNTPHITPELTIEDIFGEHVITEGRHTNERIEMDWISTEIYIVGRDELVNTTSKKENLDIMD